VTRLQRAARNAVTQCLGVRPTEAVLVITDPPLQPIGECLREAAERVCREAVLVTISPRPTHGSEPPEQLADLMRRFDALLVPTSKSMSHTEARRAACAAGVRCATLPGITEDIMGRTVGADYRRVARLSKKVAKALHRASEARITTAAGTDLTMSIASRPGIADTGILRKKGEFGNLPAGEGFLAPVEGASEGVLVVDGSMAGVGLLEQPITIEVAKGEAIRVRGGPGARKLAALIRKAGRKARNVAELGVGTNHKAILTGNVLEDEKILGTVHVAFGDNVSMGGRVSVRSHLDGVVQKPTLALDGKVVMAKGKMLL
jgi:leucyl aminopeptidase (aminopeptidase T)